MEIVYAHSRHFRSFHQALTEVALERFKYRKLDGRYFDCLLMAKFL
jgi:hypothetical protein